MSAPEAGSVAWFLDGWDAKSYSERRAVIMDLTAPVHAHALLPVLAELVNLHPCAQITEMEPRTCIELIGTSIASVLGDCISGALATLSREELEPYVPLLHNVNAARIAQTRDEAERLARLVADTREAGMALATQTNPPRVVLGVSPALGTIRYAVLRPLPAFPKQIDGFWNVVPSDSLGWDPKRGCGIGLDQDGALIEYHARGDALVGREALVTSFCIDAGTSHRLKFDRIPCARE